MSSLAAGLGCLSMLLTGGAKVALAADNLLTNHVRAADARFADVKQAIAEGYAPIPCADDAGGGSMGVHYANADRSRPTPSTSTSRRRFSTSRRRTAASS